MANLALDYQIIKEAGKIASGLSHITSCPHPHLFCLIPFVLNFIFAEKQCILTITRHNGATRSYTLKPKFSCKTEARAATAVIAIDMGIIDFIKHGSPEAVTKCGLVLALLNASGSVQEPSAMDAEEDPAVKEIEKCCAKCRAGRVEPCWIFLVDNKPTGSEHLPPYIYFSVDIFPL